MEKMDPKINEGKRKRFENEILNISLTMVVL